jgi:hypothetical protein
MVILLAVPPRPAAIGAALSARKTVPTAIIVAVIASRRTIALQKLSEAVHIGHYFNVLALMSVS